MPDPIFERYKEALKAGHVAVLRGRSDEAIAHYREAADIAPDRPLPHTSLGGVLVREGRLDEALAAYARALGRAPRDEAALSGRAEALLAADRPAEAAEILERLADVQAKTDRRPEALATLRRAVALESSRARRRRIKELEAIDAPPRPVRTRITSRLPRPRRPVAAAAPAAAEAAEAVPAETVASLRRPRPTRRRCWRPPTPCSMTICASRRLRPTLRPPPPSSASMNRPPPSMPANAGSKPRPARPSCTSSWPGSTSRVAGATARPTSCCCSTA